MKRARQLCLVNAAAPVVPGKPLTLDEKRAAAIKTLGDRWVLHKDFRKANLRTGYLNIWKAGRSKTFGVTTKEKA